MLELAGVSASWRRRRQGTAIVYGGKQEGTTRDETREARGKGRGASERAWAGGREGA